MVSPAKNALFRLAGYFDGYPINDPKDKRYKLHIRIATVLNGNDGVDIDLGDISPDESNTEKKYTLTCSFTSKRNYYITIYNDFFSLDDIKTTKPTPSILFPKENVHETNADILVTTPMDYKVLFTPPAWETQEQIIKYHGYLETDKKSLYNDLSLPNSCLRLLPENKLVITGRMNGTGIY